MSETLKELQTQLFFSDDRVERIALAERAILLAEEVNDQETAYDLRNQLIEDATFGGRPLKAIIAFGHNLKYADEHTEEIGWGTILWSYKWVISSATKFPQVSYDKIFELLEDFKRRITEFGDNLSAYYTMRFAIASNMGDLEGLQKYHQLQKDTPSGRFDNCHACVIDDYVTYCANIEGLASAQKQAKGILSGDLSCGSVPQATYDTLIQVALKEQDVQTAEQYRQIIYPMIKNDENFVGELGFHLIILSAQERYDEALPIFKAKYKLIHNPANSGIGFYEFHLGASILFQNLSQKAQKEVVLPFSIEGICTKGEAVSTTSLFEHFEQHLDRQAQLFDQRNRNTSYTDEASLFKKLYYV